MESYGLTGGVQNALVYPVLPVDFAAVADDFETITLTWDETDMEGEILQIQISEGELSLGSGETLTTTALIGTDTSFTDYKPGDLVYVVGETVRVIASIEDDTHLTVTEAFENTDDTLALYFSTTWDDLAELKPDIETYESDGLTEEMAYFYRMRIYRRLKWSAWNSLIVVAITPAEQE